MRLSKTLYLGYGLGVLALLLDQFHKFAMLEWVQIAARPPIEVTSFFNLVMVWNHGVSFGLFSDTDPNNAYFLIGLALCICIALLVWLHKTELHLEAAAIGMIIGGALGNVVDRVRFGAVADFFDFHFSGYHYPAFNIADAAIFLGVGALFFVSVRNGRKPCKDAD